MIKDLSGHTANNGGKIKVPTKILFCRIKSEMLVYYITTTSPFFPLFTDNESQRDCISCQCLYLVGTVTGD